MDESTSIRLATVGTVSGSAAARYATLKFDGATEESEKKFKVLNGTLLSKGDRVVILKISGSYVILGRI